MFLLLACTIGDPGPATPGSPAAVEVENVQHVASQAAEVEALAKELEAAAAAARSAAGPDREQRIARMRALVADVEAKNAALQADAKALEERIRWKPADEPPAAAQE
jgi:hypothetical protein